MEVRRAADILLRSNSSPLTTFLIPASTARWAAQRQLRCKHATSRPSKFRRTFMTGSRNLALGPQSTAFPPPPPQSESAKSSSNEDGSSSSTDTERDQTQAKEDSRSDLSSLSSSLWSSTKNSAVHRTNPFSNSSASDMLKSFNRAAPQAYRSEIDISRMLDPLNSTPPPSRGLATTEERELYSTIDLEEMNSFIPGPIPRQPMRLNPSTGRSVSVGADVDVGRAFRMVDISCAQNRVRHESLKQRFHERGGLKRKRLRRDRWRKRFKEGFTATVARVNQLKRQGW
ncbi:uncharacterized protein BP5553_03230 [Venustampulla echinocandica]|uniref:Ribosomal protein S21 n=1 Tax=Venustampulla echinocandica TaxID=2656787 RepID=A0A370TTQ0_9HELO|nr:uncharacterized protein BP5553_03230 [Venustampulla echinocandica]RDL38890.1 hypothetical protein BP5553_03230 [Venustampulla echinocandica]